MEVKIICPSRKRADIFKTDIENMIVLIDIKEKKQYEDLPHEKIYHNSLTSLSEIRQFAYTEFKNIFFVDDDIVSVEKLYETNNQNLTAREIFDLIQEAAYTAKELGAKLFGFNNDASPTHYNQHKPFMLNGYINGCAFGLFEDKNLFFHKDTTACESHWINLLNAYYNRYCFIDKRFHFRQQSNSTFLLKGGQSGKRTIDTEKQDTLFLRKMFGNSIQLKKMQNKTLQLHEYQRVLNLKI